MFKGTTVLELNAATMQQAVQEYLQKRINEDETPKFTVTEVKESSTRQGLGVVFRITVAEEVNTK